MPSRQCREAAEIAAAADNGAVVGALDVSQNSGRRDLRAVELAVRHDARADARTKIHEYDAGVIARRSRTPLSERHDLDVVVDPHRSAVSFDETLSHGVAVPAGHDRRRHGSAGRELDRTRDPDA